MSAIRNEYLEYIDVVDDEMNKSKQKINELKEQLANFDVSYSKDMSKSIFTESPLKPKAFNFATFDSRDAMQGAERFDEQHFSLDNRDGNKDADEAAQEEPEQQVENVQEYLGSNQAIQPLRDLGSPIEQQEDNADPEQLNLSKLYKYFKEK